MNAAMIEHFDPVDMTLPEIEAMQAKLADLAARRRAEEDGPPEMNQEADFFGLGPDKDWKAAGELEDVWEKEDGLEPFNPDEDDWRSLGDSDPE